MSLKMSPTLTVFLFVVIALAAIAAVGAARAESGAECAKLLGRGEAAYRTCLAISRGNPNECASIQDVTARVQCRAQAGASANSR